MAGGEDGPPKDWERAWTVDEMRTKSNDWSLASDAGMLQYLQEFSQKMISRTHTIQEEVNGLVHEAKLSGVRVNNVFNDFIMLANTQFVENRVYDEDVNQEETATKKEEEQEKTKEQKDAELIAKIAGAINTGMNVMESAFEKLDIAEAVSDSDGEDTETPYKTDPILEPKDPYLTRPLPHLIGTPAFYQTDDVGLTEDLSEEEEAAVNSVSESSESEESESESEDDVKGGPQKQPIYSDSETESEQSASSDLFGEKEPEEEYLSNSDDDASGSDMEDIIKRDEPEEPPQPASFADELAAKIGGAPPPSKPKQSEKKETKKREKRPSVKEEPDNDDLFGGSNRVDEYDDDFGTQDGGLFSTKGGLFDDDPVEGGGLFGDIAPKKSTKKDTPLAVDDTEEDVKPVSKPSEKTKKTESKKSSKKAASTFLDEDGDDEGDLFGTTSKKDEQRSKASAPRDVSGLFGEASDTEPDDLFASLSSTQSQNKTSVPTEKPKKSKAASLLVDSEEEEEGGLFGSVTAPAQPKEPVPPAEEEKPKKKLPPGAVPMFGGGNPFANAIKAQRKDESSESEEWSDEEPSIKPTLVIPAKQPSDSPEDSPVPARRHAEPAKSSATPAGSLFADEDDDLFGSTKPSSNKPSASKPAPTKIPSGPALFGNDNEDEEDDLFASFSKSTKKAPVKHTEPPKPAQSKKPLIDSEEEDGGSDLFGSAPVPASATSQQIRKKPVGGVSMFGDNFKLPSKRDEHQEEDTDSDNAPSDPLISAQPPVMITNRKPVIKHVPREEQKDDLFGAAESKPAKKKPVGGVSMFGGYVPPSARKTETSEESPEPSPVKSSAVKTPSSKPPLSLFDDDDNDTGGDLFGGGMPSSPNQKPTSKPPSLSKNVPSKPASSSLFGESDSLFGASPSQDGAIFSKPTQSKPSAPKPVTSLPPLFGSPDDDMDDEDDIFKTLATKSKKTPPVQHNPSSSSSPFQKPIKKPEPSPPKSAIPKLDTVKSYVKDDSESDPLGLNSSVPVKTLPPGVRTVKPPQKAQSGPTISIVKPVGPPGRATGISKTKATLNINPAALLPGAQPRTKAAEPAATGFDDEVKSDTLEHLGKSRAKIQTKRRPPSRRARQQAAVTSPESDSAPLVSSNPASSPLTNHVTESRRVPPTSRADDELHKPTARASQQPRPAPATSDGIFDEEDGKDDLFGSTGKSDPFSRTSEKPISSGSPQDPLFNGASSEQGSKKKIEPPKTNPSNDDIFDDPFGESIAKSKDLFSSVSETKPAMTKSPLDDDDFLSSKASVKPEPQKPDKKSVAVVIPAVDTDDIFGSREGPPPLTDSKPSPPEDDIFGISSSASKSMGNAFNGDDDEDDMFGANSATSVITKAKAAPVVADNDDDIFGGSSKPGPPPFPEDDTRESKSSKKSKKEAKSKKAVPLKDEDLFADDTDIFADTPSSKTNKSQKKSKASAKGLFGDDVDDIFSDSASKPRKSTAKKSSSAKKTTTADTSDIFADPLQDDDIFK